jgi:predicted  nucleic acid-binding Zn ribbon protein
MNCNLEVLPETLAMSDSLTESIARWRRVHDALYLLWLESGDYESWARLQLLNFSSQVNRLGVQSQAELNKIRKCYYMLFQDIGNLETERMRNCPACNKQFERYCLSKLQEQWMTCEDCQLVIQAP